MASRPIPLVCYKNGARIVIGRAYVDANAGLAMIGEIAIDPSTPMNQYIVNQLTRPEKEVA